MNDHSRLLWRCRRGIREMDLLLERFLQQQYPLLSDNEKKLFDLLLDESDPDLMNWIMGRTVPDNTAYMPLLAMLRSLNPEPRDDHAG